MARGAGNFTSLISLYYYLQVIRQMYIQPAPGAPADGEEQNAEEEEPEHESDEHLHTPAHHEPAADYVPLPRPSPALIAVVGIGLVATIALGVYPAPLLELVESASAAILPGS